MILRVAICGFAVIIMWTSMLFHARAAVIGGITPNSPDALAQQMEALYVAMISSKQLPVKTVKMNAGDSIEKVMRRELAFQGAYFPVVLDSLTCDLNPQYCKRDLRKDDLTGVIEIKSLLQLKLTPGDWKALKSNDLILIPQLQIEQNLIPKIYRKAKGENVESLFEKNEVCVTESKAAGECKALFAFMNNSIEKYSSLDFEGKIYVPAYNYIITVQQDCLEICAALADPLIVDLTNDTFVSQPFSLITSSAQNTRSHGIVQQEVKLKRDLPSTAHSLDEGRNNNLVLSGEIAQKLVAGKRIIEKNLWLRSSPANKFSAATPDYPNYFDINRQLSLLKGINFPLQNISGLKELFENAGMNHSVLVIDSSFDKDHCKLKDRVKVYDCRSVANQPETLCKLKSDSFNYEIMSNESENKQVTAKSVENLPPLCGPAGVVEVESPVDSDVYIAPRHGTHLSGIIGAGWDNFGAGGLNPFANIIGIETNMQQLSDEGYGKWLLKRVKQIIYKEHSYVVNFSAGYALKTHSLSSQRTEPVQDWFTTLISDLRDQATFVVSAGNSPDPNCLTMPACAVERQKNVIAVVAMNNSGTAVWPNASVDERFSIGAPAEQVFGAMPRNKFGYLSGSSQSAAIVSGAVSLSKSIGVSTHWPPSIIRSRLIACSNILKTSILDASKGGQLDVSCFLAGTDDLISLSKTMDTSISGSLISTFPLGMKLSFQTYDAGDVILDVGRIVGFQKLEGVTDDVIVFYSKTTDLSSGKLERLRGVFTPGQTIRLQQKTSISSFKVDEIFKYVRRAGW